MRDPNAKTLVNVALVKEMRERRGGKSSSAATPDANRASVPASPSAPGSKTTTPTR